MQWSGAGQAIDSRLLLISGVGGDADGIELRAARPAPITTTSGTSQRTGAGSRLTARSCTRRTRTAG